MDFVRREYPNISTSGLGDDQDTEQKRLTSWAKGYTEGQCVLFIPRINKYYRRLAIEFKSPTGTGRLSSE